ncbi:unnamed protein product [Amoebophrya sp. A25]|nr:unnamed protein product [Amoebophrya sp. A25]|eukprot:GSA25T00012515001.1
MSKEHAVNMVLEELPRLVECLQEQHLVEKLHPQIQQKLNQCVEHGASVLEPLSSGQAVTDEGALAGQRLFFGDLLQVTAHALTQFSRAHEVEGPVAPFMHSFTLSTVIFSQFVGAQEPVVAYIPPETFVAATEEQMYDPVASIGEHILGLIGDHFDYCLREVVFNCGSDDTSNDEVLHAKICCRVMWRTLALCLGGADKIDGEMFLELCGNEVYFPVAFARTLIPCESDIAVPLMALWSNTANVKAATRVAEQQSSTLAILEEEGGRQLPNDETGDLADVYEYKKQIACAFVDDDIIQELLRALASALKQWESLPEVQQWFMAVLESPDLSQVLVPQPPVPLGYKAQELARSVLLLFAATCRCMSEIANVCLDPHYRVWAGRYPSLIGRMQRHLTLHGKGFVTHLIKPHFAPHNAVGMNSDLDLKLRMLVLSRQTHAAKQDIDRSVFRMSCVCLDTLLALKHVNCDQVIGVDFLSLVANGLQNPAPVLSSAADATVSAKAALLSMNPADYTVSMDADGASLEHDMERLTSELAEKVRLLALPRGLAENAAYWRTCKKYLQKALENGGAAGAIRDFWEGSVVANAGPLMGGQNLAAADAQAVEEQAGTDMLAGMGLFAAGTGEAPAAVLEDYNSQGVNAGEQLVANGVVDPSLLLADDAPSAEVVGQLSGVGGNKGHSQRPREAIPEEFRCAIDGKFLQTPIRWTSPTTGISYVYELATLQAWAAVQGDICPVTGEAFTPDNPPAVDEALTARLQEFATGFAA